jgi:glycosyltransferase involved in cell wall biosynthesis
LRFSIVIPCFNVADTISRAIDSVLAQTLSDFELLFVDDGSTDDTSAIVLDLVRGTPLIRTRARLLQQDNRGPGAARNLGMAQARGDFICFLDADDLWSPRYLARVGSIYEELPELGALAVNAWHLNAGGYRLHIQARDNRPVLVDDYFEARLAGTMAVHTSGVTIRNWIPGKIGCFREDLRRSQDTEYWARLAAAGVRWGFSPEPLVIYDRSRDSSLSHGPSWHMNVPSPETWGREIWPLVDSRLRESFRSVYLKRAKGYCSAFLKAGDGRAARITAREALSRATRWQDRLAFGTARLAPGKACQAGAAAGRTAKRLLRSLGARGPRAAASRPDFGPDCSDPPGQERPADETSGNKAAEGKGRNATHPQ